MRNTWLLNVKENAKMKKKWLQYTSLDNSIYTQRIPASSVNQKAMTTDVRAGDKGEGSNLVYYLNNI